MKFLTTNMILAFAVILTACDAACARPFSITAVSNLSAVSDDPYDLDGAVLEMIFSADTTDASTRSIDNGERIREFFNVFTQTLNFTNRPNARPDILQITVTNDPVITNYYIGPNEDSLEFDSRSHEGLPDLENKPMYIPSLIIDLGSHTFLPGDDRPTLQWFETIIPSQIIPGPGSMSAYSTRQLALADGPGLPFPVPIPGFPAPVQYNLTNTVITHNAPEPATTSLMAIGAIAILRPRRRRA